VQNTNTTITDRNLEQSTTISLKREPACFAFLCARAISAPIPIDTINLDLASADWYDGRASIWATLDIRSAATNDRPTAVLGFDESFLRPFTRAVLEAATTRTAFRMSVLPGGDDAPKPRVVEYVTGDTKPLAEIVLTPHDHVILVSAALEEGEPEETLFQLPRTDSFLRAFAKMTHQADQALKDTVADMEKLARRKQAAA
jgi:hypothetical protein